MEESQKKMVGDNPFLEDEDDFANPFLNGEDQNYSENIDDAHPQEFDDGGNFGEDEFVFESDKQQVFQEPAYPIELDSNSESESEVQIISETSGAVSAADPPRKKRKRARKNKKKKKKKKEAIRDGELLQPPPPVLPQVVHTKKVLHDGMTLGERLDAKLLGGKLLGSSQVLPIPKRQVVPASVWCPDSARFMVPELQQQYGATEPNAVNISKSSFEKLAAKNKWTVAKCNGRELQQTVAKKITKNGKIVTFLHWAETGEVKFRAEPKRIWTRQEIVDRLEKSVDEEEDVGGLVISSSALPMSKGRVETSFAAVVASMGQEDEDAYLDSMIQEAGEPAGKRQKVDNPFYESPRASLDEDRDDGMDDDLVEVINVEDDSAGSAHSSKGKKGLKWRDLPGKTSSEKRQYIKDHKLMCLEKKGLFVPFDSVAQGEIQRYDDQSYAKREERIIRKAEERNRLKGLGKRKGYAAGKMGSMPLKQLKKLFSHHHDEDGKGSSSGKKGLAAPSRLAPLFSTQVPPIPEEQEGPSLAALLMRETGASVLPIPSKEFKMKAYNERVQRRRESAGIMKPPGQDYHPAFNAGKEQGRLEALREPLSLEIAERYHPAFNAGKEQGRLEALREMGFLHEMPSSSSNVYSAFGEAEPPPLKDLIPPPPHPSTLQERDTTFKPPPPPISPTLSAPDTSYKQPPVPRMVFDPEIAPFGSQLQKKAFEPSLKVPPPPSPNADDMKAYKLSRQDSLTGNVMPPGGQEEVIKRRMPEPGKPQLAPVVLGPEALPPVPRPKQRPRRPPPPPASGVMKIPARGELFAEGGKGNHVLKIPLKGSLKGSSFQNPLKPTHSLADMLGKSGGF